MVDCLPPAEAAPPPAPAGLPIRLDFVFGESVTGDWLDIGLPVGGFNSACGGLSS